MSLVLACGVLGWAASADKSLLVHYTFEEGAQEADKKIQQVYDHSAHGNNGTVYHAKYAQTSRGYVLALGGRKGFVKCAAQKRVNFGKDDFTILLTLKLDSLKSGMILAKKGTTKGAAGWDLSYDKAARQVVFTVSDGQRQEHLGMPLADTRWRHVALVRSGKTATFYENGEVVASGDGDLFGGDIGNETSFLYLGRAIGPTMTFHGKLDDVFIYAKALSAGDIAAVHVAQKETTPPPDAARQADGNILADAGFELETAVDWTGTSAVFQRVQTQAHTGVRCLQVKDSSRTACGYASGNPVRVSLQGGGRFYAEAWARIDDTMASRTGYATASIDIAFYDARGKFLLSQNVGKISSAKRWERLSGLVTLPYEAALIGFRVTPAEHVASLMGSVLVDDLYLAPLPVAEAAGRVKLASAAVPPKGAPEYVAPARPTDGANMALTVEKLAKGFDPQRPLVIWAIGSSFTDFLGNGDELISMIRKNFPDAPPIVYKKMVGGSTPYHLLRGWARHLVSPDHPDVVLTYNFGETAGLEKTIRELRAHTTADIVVGTLHWCRNHKEQWPDPELANRHLDPVSLRKMCAQYGVEFVETRRDITQYMVANNLEIKDLLVDPVHQSPYAAKMINASIARHFRRAAQPGYDPRSRERRIEAESASVKRTGAWTADRSGTALTASPNKGDGELTVQFTGTRIDLIGWRAQPGGAVRVWIDGVPAGQAKAFSATYVQPDPGNFIDLNAPKVDFRRVISDRCPHGIGLGENIVPQTWTLTMTSDKGDYKLVGGVTGPDGDGNAFKPFTSRSGQIVVDPTLWRLASTNRTGDRFTFEVKRTALERIHFAGADGKFRACVVENLANEPHTLRLRAEGDGPVSIDAFDVFEPPLKSETR